MLLLHSRKLPLAGDVDLETLADETEGCVGADIAGLCRLAALAALGRDGAAAEAASLRVLRQDFALAQLQLAEGRTWQVG